MTKIPVTHAGSLPRPAELVELNRRKAGGEPVDAAECLARSVKEIVKKQLALDIDVPDDGEFGKATTSAYDYGAWQSYIFERLICHKAPCSTAPNPSA